MNECYIDTELFQTPKAFYRTNGETQQGWASGRYCDCRRQNGSPNVSTWNENKCLEASITLTVYGKRESA